MNEDKKTERRREIIAVCLDCFVEKGLTITTTKDLCTAAKLQNGGIYYYFSTKEEIVLACAEAAIERIEKGAFGIPVPPANAPVAHPDVIVAPLSAFDRKGGRTGYGGGFYDRTLAAFETKPFYVGAAFGAQECDEIPCEKTDFTLDCIVTEKEIIRIRS